MGIATGSSPNSGIAEQMNSSVTSTRDPAIQVLEGPILTRNL